MWIKLVSMLFRRAVVIAGSRGVQLGAGAAAIAEIINIDVMHREALKIAPGSDAAALHNAAETVLRWLGGAGDEVMWPTHKTGPLAGQPIAPNYLTIDMARGRAWFHETYTKRRRFMARGRGGYRRSYRRRY
jgi:hypothetical protein